MKRRHGRTETENRHPHARQQPGAQRRDREAQNFRIRFCGGQSADRRLPPHGARARIRHLRDGDHHLYLRPRPWQAHDRGADLPGARLPSWRHSGEHQGRHSQPQGSGGQARRGEPRLHGDDRRVGAQHPAGRIRRRSFQDHLGAVGRRACGGVRAAEERRADREGKEDGGHAQLRRAGRRHRRRNGLARREAADPERAGGGVWRR